jgi:quercetin dioxygenase-like cupin family protein
MPFEELDKLEWRERFAGFKGRFVHSATMSFVHWQIEAGAVLPEHSHPHEQVAHVVAGEFELTIDDETHVLRAGCVGVIPGGARHSGRALTDCFIIDAFHPVREDYRQQD